MTIDVKGLCLQKGCFQKNTNLDLFSDNKNHKCQLSIVYGKNGSGKSTIANAFNSLKVDNDSNIFLIDYNGNKITNLPDIFVFNESFIDNNIKIKDEGLDSILLLGDMVPIENKINSLYKEIEELEDDIQRNKFDENFDYLENRIRQTDTQIRNILNSSWSKYVKIIKDNPKAGPVSKLVIKELGEKNITRSYKEVIKDFDESFSVFTTIMKINSIDSCKMHCLEIEEDIDNEICQLLSLKIHTPELNEKEQYLLDIISSGRRFIVEDAKKVMSSDDIEVCPYCLQKINYNQKESLKKYISNILNEDVEQHIEDLKCIKFPVIDFDLTDAVFLIKEDFMSQNDLKELTKLLYDCENTMNYYQENIDKKLLNVYEPIKIENKGLYQLISHFNYKLNEFLKKYKTIEDAFSNKDKFIKGLLELNKDRASFDIKDLYSVWNLLTKEKNDKIKSQDSLLLQLNSKKEELNQETMKYRGIDIAIDRINSFLSYIFLDNKRLCICYKNDKFILESNGVRVKPKELSIGERNIIALCYFFTKVLSQKNYDINFSTKESIVIIDDPISSFDSTNKVGLSSFLRFQAEIFLNTKTNNKILMLTHDIQTFFDFLKIGDDIMKEFDKNNINNLTGKSLKVASFMLKDRKLEVKGAKLNLYNLLLLDIYEFANEESDDNSKNIGNSIRKVVESFSTFVYKTGISELSLIPSVISKLGNKADYFKNSMYRLVLHGDSHGEEAVRSLNDNLNFYNTIDIEEKRRVAKDILCMLYLINPDHMKKYLNCDDRIKNIQKWLEDIKL